MGARFKLEQLSAAQRAEAATQIKLERVEMPATQARASQDTPASITLTLPYPPSANNYWRNIVVNGRARTVVSREAREYKATVRAIATGAGLRPIDGPVSMTVNVYRPIRRGDLVNRLKVLEDSLEGFAYHNDDQIVETHAHRLDDKQNPRVELTIRLIA